MFGENINPLISNKNVLSKKLLGKNPFSDKEQIDIYIVFTSMQNRIASKRHCYFGCHSKLLELKKVLVVLLELFLPKELHE